MKALCFTLGGKTAFFKKPEVNSYYYFTYGNLHKNALLGMFGAILGYGGYTQQFQKDGQKKGLQRGYPEFYEKLEKLHISIKPNTEKGFFSKKIQQYNNSVGYASKEAGGNLIVKEQWLENPSWQVCVLLDSEEAELLAEYIIKRKCVYIPYLGKNDHLADISDVHVEEVTWQESGEGRLIGLFLKKGVEIQQKFSLRGKRNMTYKYQEDLPLGMDVWTNQYELETFMDTDAEVKWKNQKVYVVEGQCRMFY